MEDAQNIRIQPSGDPLVDRLRQQELHEIQIAQMIEQARQFGAMARFGGRRFSYGGFGSGPDIDNMSYEELIQRFGDGSENRGAKSRDIMQLPVSIVKDPEKELPEDARQCMICLEDFEPGDRRMTLPCLHGFHEACCKKWLKQNGSCPVCKARVDEQPRSFP